MTFCRVKITEVSLNVDTLTQTKVDAKCASLIFSEILIIDRIELFPDKVEPKTVEKVYEMNARRPKSK